MKPLEKQLDKLVSSDRPWLVLIGCSITPPIFVGVALLKERVPNGTEDWLIPGFVAIALVGALIVGFLIGLFVIGMKKYANHVQSGSRPPRHLRLVYSHWKMKLILLTPVLFVLICAIAVWTA